MNAQAFDFIKHHVKQGHKVTVCYFGAYEPGANHDRLVIRCDSCDLPLYNIACEGDTHEVP